MPKHQSITYSRHLDNPQYVDINVSRAPEKRPGVFGIGAGTPSCSFSYTAFGQTKDACGSRAHGKHTSITPCAHGTPHMPLKSAKNMFRPHPRTPPWVTDRCDVATRQVAAATRRVVTGWGWVDPGGGGGGTGSGRLEQLEWWGCLHTAQPLAPSMASKGPRLETV
jgi:hypothetical protein